MVTEAVSEKEEEADLVATIRQRLLTLQDPAYRAFQIRLIPTVDPDRIIGVRTPALRQCSLCTGVETLRTWRIRHCLQWCTDT